MANLLKTHHIFSRFGMIIGWYIFDRESVVREKYGEIPRVSTCHGCSLCSSARVAARAAHESNHSSVKLLSVHNPVAARALATRATWVWGHDRSCRLIFGHINVL